MKIKKKISEQDSSVHALEKKAGLKPSAIQNIIYGRSKNPSITLIQAISQALDCNIEDLVDAETFNHQQLQNSLPTKSSKQESTDLSKTRAWNQDLYLRCFNTVHSILNDFNIIVDKNKILDIVDEIYNYSLGNNQKEPDIYFANWLIERKLT